MADSIELNIKTEDVPAGPSRDLGAAKDAYKKGDVDASKAAHAKQGLLRNDHTTKAAEAHGGMGGEYVKSIVFGGLDGIITTFAIISASAGAGFKLEVILLMGFANLIADGISMGFGDFLSEQAEMDHAIRERKREMWEVENHLEGEIEEMVEIYQGKGMSKEEATTVVTIMSRHKNLFVDVMMADELGLTPPDEDDAPWKNGCVTFLAFLLFGSVPLWCYVVFYVAGVQNPNTMFIICCVATALTMFLLGAFKAKITAQNMLKSGLFMTLNGSIAAAAAFLVGYMFEQGFEIKMDQCN